MSHLNLQHHEKEGDTAATAAEPKSCEPVSTEPLKKNQVSFFKTFEKAIAILVYCTSSIATTVLNKYILSDLNFGLNCLLLVVQCVITMFLLLFLRITGVLKFRLVRLHELLTWLPVTTALSLMIFTGTKVLEHCNISVVMVFKNSSVLFIALGDMIFYGKKIFPLSYLSFIVIIISSLLGLLSDDKYSLRGVVWLVLNCIFSATYTLSVKGFADKISFSNLDAVFNNNMIMSIFFLILSPFVDNWSAILKTQDHALYSGKGLNVVVSVLVSSVSAFAISTGTIWAVRATSPTTFIVVSVLTKLPASFSGIIFLKNESAANPYKIFSIFLGFIAGALYSFSSYFERRKAQRRLKL